MIELIIYALVAAFIFSRLFHSLGQSTYFHLHALTIAHDDNMERNVENIDDYIDSHNINSMKLIYKEILQHQKDFSIKNFIEGAAIAFELIIKYFTQGNVQQLQSLVDQDLYNNFTEMIKCRTYVYNTTIVAIISQKIIEMQLIQNVLFITVNFISEQINFAKNHKGDIVSGSTSVINRIEDKWQFKKNISLLESNWLLVSINYQKFHDDNESQAHKLAIIK
ncbi:Tim44/TimA family putative adaptor protein [Wolbachia endosymbiont of Howardula sp.]|uniref:Tim44/TimA family putative adaptor protein n=1 Tax=Wolbachia endosymbiont of Howardula sp. TaxID=2916816 RepID=UPI00217D94A7|nr:Tim44/TimA family putative adaptor protein [Wolbachia endosymbiont of Howardula sp.]UWI83086.1 Tim44/TimA family putative adaptor protein [Wolbachia endosymbiont of Howardula sp.]